MKVYHLSDMIKGWFVGNFEPSVLKTNDVEVGVKSYKAGDSEARHYHKLATEITVILKGKVRINDEEFSEGDIIVMETNEVADFTALTDVVNVVVKHPGASNDKYECGDDHA